jgi:hypothetical protein
MDNLCDDCAAESSDSETNFGKDLTKSFAIATAVTTGVLAGFMVVGLTVNKVQEKLEARKAKKQKPNLTVVK